MSKWTALFVIAAATAAIFAVFLGVMRLIARRAERRLDLGDERHSVSSASRIDHIATDQALHESDNL